ncbi:MAG: imidazolonepropionase, partial [Proteobacteria bacterium]|nr:imidazolonepropionase [Pseudomonadota bacterium]
MAGLLIVNCAQLITMQPLAKDRRFTHIKDADLGRINNAWLAVEAGKVLDFGENPIPEKYHTWPQLDAKGSLVTPGLIDCHSHPIFGGDRTDEFRQKLAGASYQDIAARGGGIKSTIKATRAATSETLLQNTQQILKIFLSHGVTSLEAKTGYGQSPAEELRLLRILKQVANTGPQTIAVTCLALHDIPSECSDKQSFIQGMQDELLPVLVKEQLADWVDAFIEDGYFSVSEAEAFIQKALDLG